MQPAESLSSKSAAKEKRKTRKVIRKIVLGNFYSMTAIYLTAILKVKTILKIHS